MKTLITGTSNGIGKAIALKFLSRGFRVTGIDKEKSTIDDPLYTHLCLDLCFDVLPDIDNVGILINCAGVQNGPDDIEVNLKALMRVTEKYGLQPKIKAILNIASAGARSGAEFPAYVAAKGGVIAYTKNVALRIAAYGAVCNSLSPGGVITASNAHIIDNPVLWDKVLKETLLGKWAEADEIGEWAYFICVVNKSMTAQDILIDNGEIAKSNFIW